MQEGVPRRTALLLALLLALGGVAHGRPASAPGTATPLAATVTPERSAEKFARVERFAGRLPQLRSWVEGTLAEPKLDRQTALAAIVRIMDRTYMRVGSDRYASRKEKAASYGASSLLKQHVTVLGDTVLFQFRGKAGVHWQRELVDPQLASTVRLFLATAGERLFQVPGPAGARPITERHVEQLLAGYGAKPKDLRTLHANRLLAEELGKLGAPASAAEAEKLLGGAIRKVARQLGHTPGVCRAAYLNPTTLSEYAGKLR